MTPSSDFVIQWNLLPPGGTRQGGFLKGAEGRMEPLPPRPGTSELRRTRDFADWFLQSAEVIRRHDPHHSVRRERDTLAAKTAVGYPPVSAVPVGGGVDHNLGLDAKKRRG